MKKYVPYIAIILIGFLAAGFSYAKLTSATLHDKKTINIVVPAEDIPAYKKLLPSDLTLKKAAYNDVLAGTVTDPSYAVGKYTKTALYAGWPIKKDLLSEEGDIFYNKDVVAIAVDYTRSAGAKPGDIVDVYYVVPQRDKLSVDTASKVASDAIVVKVDGINVKTGSASSIGTAVLAVDKSFTQFIVPGALKDNTMYVLAVKQQSTSDSSSGITQELFEGPKEQKAEDTK